MEPRGVLPARGSVERREQQQRDRPPSCPGNGTATGQCPRQPITAFENWLGHRAIFLLACYSDLFNHSDGNVRNMGFHLLLSKQRLPYPFQPKQASANPRKIFPREWLLNAMTQQK